MEREPRLIGFGREGGEAAPAVRAVALLLPGGFVRGRGRYWRVVDLPMRNLAQLLAARGSDRGIGVELLRYRYRGWNGDRADPLVDTRWALDRLAERHGPVPVVLVGNSMGGRAAFRAAGGSTVAGVVGVAPWLAKGEPVEGLAGRKVLILHGDRDRSEAPHGISLDYALRARAVVPDAARFEVVGAGHYLLARARDCWSMTADFVLGVVGAAPWAPALAAAMAATAPAGLRTPLPSGGATR